MTNTLMHEHSNDISVSYVDIFHITKSLILSICLILGAIRVLFDLIAAAPSRKVKKHLGVTESES